MILISLGSYFRIEKIPSQILKDIYFFTIAFHTKLKYFFYFIFISHFFTTSNRSSKKFAMIFWPLENFVLIFKFLNGTTINELNNVILLLSIAQQVVWCDLKKKSKITFYFKFIDRQFLLSINNKKVEMCRPMK